MPYLTIELQRAEFILYARLRRDNEEIMKYNKEICQSRYTYGYENGRFITTLRTNLNKP